MRTAGIVLGLLGALTLAVGCGDDDNEKKDSGTKVYLDKGTTQLDTGPQPDTGTTVDQYVPLPDQGVPGKNSGDICDPKGTVKCTNAGETCVTLSGWTKGMCVNTCQKGTTCPVANSATMLSTCGLTDSTQTKWWCVFVCEYQKKTYSCPDATKYDCIASSTAGVKICKPK